MVLLETLDLNKKLYSELNFLYIYNQFHQLQPSDYDTIYEYGFHPLLINGCTEY